MLLVLGDSLSAEYGLARGAGWVALLEKRLAAEKLAWRVVNASISGETTSGGRSRLAALLKQHQPRVVVLELGGNDALRGLPLDMTRNNLADMARAAKAAGARVLIAGMAMPPNYGRAYGEAFTALFATVAQAEKLLFLAEKGFELGVKTRLEVQDAELNLSSARANLARAQRDYNVARVNLEWVAGTLGQ